MGHVARDQGWPQKVLLSSFQRRSNQSVRAPLGFRVRHVNNSRIVESTGNDTSSGWHVDGVGEALVFTLKTSLQLKTGGLVYRPVSGR